MSALTLLSLNCEGHRHLDDRILPFIEREQPDVLNLQEVFAVDIPVLQERTGMRVVHFAPMCNVVETSIHTSHALGAWGVCQMTSLPVIEHQYQYYHLAGSDDRTLPIFFENNNSNHMHRALAQMTLVKDSQKYTVATTHFTWSTHGESTAEQFQDLEALLTLLGPNAEVVISGDFNAPRGKETFRRLADRFHDWIPEKYTTSLDETLHKAGKLELMVDGLFSSPHYHCANVRLVDKVSDHMAIVAEVSHR